MCTVRASARSALQIIALFVGVIAPAWGAGVPLDEARGVFTLAPVLEATAPAIVSVVASGVVRSSVRAVGLPKRGQSEGSGVIVDAAKGYILTSHHVVNGATSVAVILHDGRALEAKIVGGDVTTDIAVLRISPADLTAVPLGDPSTLRVVEGDITKLAVDAIVNAANSTLSGGGGVDGAIHSAAGPRLLDECRTLGGCATGDAKITLGYDLPARHVLHTVGLVWLGGNHGEEELLARCYRRCIALAAENHLHSVAFPAISTGAYRFPPLRAAAIAVACVRAAVALHPEVTEVTFVCFGGEAAHVYRTLLGA